MSNYVFGSTLDEFLIKLHEELKMLKIKDISTKPKNNAFKAVYTHYELNRMFEDTNKKHNTNSK